jgi:hypothetical protein
MDEKDEEGINHWESPEEYAYDEDTIDSNWGRSEKERVISGEAKRGTVILPCIVVAKKPVNFQLNEWDFSVPEHVKSFDVVAVRYRIANNNWVEKPFKVTMRK